jgi:RNA polymerase sigma factor (sigma-70 family)
MLWIPDTAGGATNGSPLTEDDERLIARKASQLVAKKWFPESDREDIEQDLRLRLWRSLAKYDPSKGPRSIYCAVVVKRRTVSLIEGMRAAKRRTLAKSRCSHGTDEDRKSALDLADASARTAHQGCRSRGDHEQLELRTDLATVLNTLDATERRLAEQLKEQSIPKAAKKVGMPTTSARRTIRTMRLRFEQADLRDYL